MEITRRMRQRILRNIVAERDDVNMDLVVIEIETWKAGKYSGTPRDIGAITVEYSTKGYHAVYGFDGLGNVRCYMD